MASPVVDGVTGDRSGSPIDPRLAGVGVLAILITGGLGFALRTSFIGTSNGGVWRSRAYVGAVNDPPARSDAATIATGRVTAIAVDPSDPSGNRSIGDPRATRSDGLAVDVPPPADYDSDGFKISESDSPRPRDR